MTYTTHGLWENSILSIEDFVLSLLLSIRFSSDKYMCIQDSFTVLQIVTIT